MAQASHDFRVRTSTHKHPEDTDQKYAGHLFARSIFRILVHGARKAEECKFLLARHRPNAKYPSNVFEAGAPFVRTYWIGIFRCVAEDLDALQNEGYRISACEEPIFTKIMAPLQMFERHFDDESGVDIPDDEADNLVTACTKWCEDAKQLIESSDDLLVQLFSFTLYVALRIFVSSEAGKNLADALVDLKASLEYGFHRLSSKLRATASQFNEEASFSKIYRSVRLAFELSVQIRVFLMAVLNGLEVSTTENMGPLRRDTISSWTPDPLSGFVFGKLGTPDSVRPLRVTPFLSNKVSFSIYDYDADYFYPWELTDDIWENEFGQYLMGDSLLLSGVWPDLDDRQRLLLFPLLYRSTSIRTVLLGDNFFGPPLSFTVAKLFNNRQIERLDLSGNEFDDVAAENLALGLKMGGQTRELSLLSLDLRGNRITDAGAMKIIKALRFVPKIEHVSLERNRVGDQTVAALISYLRDVDSRLGHIDLSYNEEITYRGPHTLDRELKANERLRRRDLVVNVRSTSWTDEDFSKLDDLDPRIRIS